MYTLTVRTHNGIEKSWNFIDLSYACEMMNVAKTCEDCAWAIITDAMTGELHKEYDYVEGITIYG
jgi:hypothetical protein